MPVEEAPRAPTMAELEAARRLVLAAINKRNGEIRELRAQLEGIHAAQDAMRITRPEPNP